MPRKLTADFLVAGAGSFGSWTALELAHRGYSVILADPYGAGNARASSGGETRIIRASYGAARHYTKMAVESLAAWRHLFAAQNKRELFHPCGALFTAEPGNSFLEASADALRDLRVNTRRLTAKALAKQYPQVQFGAGREGLLEPDSGVLMARRAVQLVTEVAEQQGVHVVREPVDPARIKSRFQVGATIFACGPWLPQIFPEELGSRIWPTRQEVFFFGAGPAYAPAKFPAWVDFGATYYALPDIENRGLKIAFDSHGPAIDPDRDTRIVTPASVRRMRQVIAQIMPTLKDAPIVETRVCQYENTSNGDFLIDWLRPGILAVGGGSGHGFKHGPAVGKIAADLAEGKIEIPPSQFAFSVKATKKARQIF
ncbi:N-methyl-L-tryptophan oxidase [Bryobacterales bacterium F-183]|nr:N-methyl-L-tryptophan oxidase [Bryobacterales bacterium F-183]